MKIEIDDLSRPEIHALLDEHLQNMYELSPPESVHALDLDKLRQPGITFWTAWDGPVLLGCGALKEIDPTHAEVKSMRTPKALRRRGAGAALLAHIVDVARSRGYRAAQPRDRQPGSIPAGAAALRQLRLHGLRAVRGLCRRPEQRLHDAAAVVGRWRRSRRPIEPFWRDFCGAVGEDRSDRFFEAFHFDDNAPSANALRRSCSRGSSARPRASSGRTSTPAWRLPQAGS
jgi:GNAT superfamily N-acetyltransferase